MNKKRLIILSIFLLVGILIGYKVYWHYTPALIANALLQEDEPSFLPNKVVEKLKKIKAPANQISEEVIKSIHTSNITIEQTLEALDGVTEEKANALLADINNLSEINSSDQIFDLAKKHFPVEFDIESLREPFRAKADVALLRRVIRKANQYHNNDMIDFETAKSIVKHILIEKEEEFKQNLEQN
jgi:hypothetical protein